MIDTDGGCLQRCLELKARFKSYLVLEFIDVMRFTTTIIHNKNNDDIDNDGDYIDDGK